MQFSKSKIDGIYRFASNSQGIPVIIVGKLFVVQENALLCRIVNYWIPLLPFFFFATTWCIYLRQPVDILDETILIKCNHDNKFQSISAKNDMNPSNNGILFPKLFWPSVRKKCSIDREKLLKYFNNSNYSNNFWDH